MLSGYFKFIVVDQYVNDVKKILSKQNAVDHRFKITEYHHERGSIRTSEPSRRVIPTTIAISLKKDITDEDSLKFLIEDRTKESLLSRFQLLHLSDYIDLEFSSDSAVSSSRARKAKNPLHSGALRWIRCLPSPLHALLPGSPKDLIDALPGTFSLYPPLLLLPLDTFSDPLWARTVAVVPQEETQRLYAELARAAGNHCTCVALNAPIPPSLSRTRNDKRGDEGIEAEENILRSPSNFIPLFGEFGPPAPLPNPTPGDFSRALWATTTQNGIRQSWAPMHTMFARGNVAEKSRLLSLPSVTSLSAPLAAVATGAWAAVDLYAGIGYFAFCYARAGAAAVLGWELSAWSVEGFRRGCEMNGWAAEIVAAGGRLSLGGDEPLGRGREPRMIVHQESNVRALSVVEDLRSEGALPPVRHVNCGLLPTSTLIWRDAVRIVDPERGGWVHLHENWASDAASLRDRREQVLGILRRYWTVAALEEREEPNENVKGSLTVEDAYVVKSYAPGVVHVVWDAWIPPERTKL